MKKIMIPGLEELTSKELDHFNGGEDRTFIEWLSFYGGWIHGEVDEFINLLGRTDWSESNYLNSGR